MTRFKKVITSSGVLYMVLFSGVVSSTEFNTTNIFNIQANHEAFQELKLLITEQT